MLRILIADDESIVRTSLRSMLEGTEDISIVADVPNGKAALEILSSEQIDLLLTDIKMPIMDGLELLAEIQKSETKPMAIILSAYDDFFYVREAFKMGIEDYLLKSDITAETLIECINHVISRVKKKNGDFKASENKIVSNDFSDYLRRFVLGETNEPHQLFESKYLIALFEVEDFQNQIKRYGSDIEFGFIKPMINYAMQIPRVAAHCHICSISPSRYLLFCSVEGQREEEAIAYVRSISEQISRNWKNYMNNIVSAGIGRLAMGSEAFSQAFQSASERLSLKLILGRGKVYDSCQDVKFNPNIAVKSEVKYKSLIAGLKAEVGINLMDEIRKYTASFHKMSLNGAINEVLCCIFSISLSFLKIGVDLAKAFDKNENFYDILSGFESVKDIEIWFINFLRMISDYVERNYRKRTADVIEKAIRFISDHLSDPSISLPAVASYVGFNEKYFSTRFCKETGRTFSVYLNELRIAKAKELLDKSDLKIYQISDQVGFNNKEHFDRVFKKMMGVSPSAYKQENI